MVDDIISLTLEVEKLKQRLAKLTKQKREYHCNRYLIPMEQVDYTKIVEDQGIGVRAATSSDGISCPSVQMPFHLFRSVPLEETAEIQAMQVILRGEHYKDASSG